MIGVYKKRNHSVLMQPYSFTMSWSSVINRISHIIDTSINNQKTRGKIMFLEVGVQKKLGKEA